MTSEDIIFISICDGYYSIHAYFPDYNDSNTTMIKSHQPLTYQYTYSELYLFKDYSYASNIYSVTDIKSFEKKYQNTPKCYYKIEYEELCNLVINSLLKESIESYKKYYNHSTTVPEIKVAYTNAFKHIKYNGKTIAQYFDKAIAENREELHIPKITTSFASDLYPYYIYKLYMFKSLCRPKLNKKKYTQCIFEIGYNTIACYIYKIKAKKLQENLTSYVKTEPEYVTTSIKLKKTVILNFGIFDLMIPLYYEIFEQMDEPDCLYDCPHSVQIHNDENLKSLCCFNSNASKIYFTDQEGDKIGVTLERYLETNRITNILQSIREIIIQYKIDTYRIISKFSYSFLFKYDFEIEEHQENETSHALIESLFYRYGIKLNKIYRNARLSEIDEQLINALNENDNLDQENKILSRKLTNTFPKIKFNTYLKEKNILASNNIHEDFIQYIHFINENHAKILAIKSRLQNTKKILAKKYEMKKINIACNKILNMMTIFNDPELLEIYINDFINDPESYF